MTIGESNDHRVNVLNLAFNEAVICDNYDFVA